MKIPFWKMHGAGNDFIVFDDREGVVPVEDTAWLAGLCARRTGVGSDGIILLQRSPSASFRMRFFNPDGREASMCGNGARCAAMLAYELGIDGPHLRIQTVAGLVPAEVLGDRVRIRMPRPRAWCGALSLSAGGSAVDADFLDTGVPHCVVHTGDPEALEALDVEGVGRALRYHERFAPEGSNADFAAVTASGVLAVRTYERGVESETLACGTGVVAAALSAWMRGRVLPPVSIRVRSGSVLEVDFAPGVDGVLPAEVTLCGPAVCVYRGVLQ